MARLQTPPRPLPTPLRRSESPPVKHYSDPANQCGNDAELHIVHSGKKRYVNRGSGESVPCLSRRRRRGGFLRLLTFALDALPVTLPVTRGRATAVLSTSARGDGQSATASPGPSTRIARACPHCPLQTAVQIFSCCLLSSHVAPPSDIFDASSFLTGASSSAGVRRYWYLS